MDLLWVKLVSLNVFLKKRITCVKSLSTGALESLVSLGMLSTKNNLPASGLPLFRTTTTTSDRMVFPLLVVQCVFWSWGHTHRWGAVLKGGVVTVYVSSLSGDSWSIKWSCCRVIWTTSVSLITRHRLEPGTSFGGWSGTGSMCTITTCITRTPLQKRIRYRVQSCDDWSTTINFYFTSLNFLEKWLDTYWIGCLNISAFIVPNRQICCSPEPSFQSKKNTNLIAERIWHNILDCNWLY